MTMLWKVILASAVMVGVLMVGGCGVSTPPVPTPVPTGGLEGLVSDGSTGAPVADAQVTVAGQAGVFTLATGPDGKYKVADLLAGAYLVSGQATGYSVNVAQVGVVANVVSSGNLALEPAAAAVAAVATAVPSTPIPTPLSPTPIVITVVVSPVPSATPAPVSTPRAQAKSAHGAPVLSEPRDGSVFVGPQQITFRWAGSCCLAADEYYVVSIPHPQGVEEAWVKTLAWTSPDYLYLLVGRSRELTWNVSVRRHTGQYPNGQWTGPIVSPLSQTWRLTWHTGGEGGPVSPLPAPPISPLALPAP
jgi:hypothetical protein